MAAGAHDDEVDAQVPGLGHDRRHGLPADQAHLDLEPARPQRLREPLEPLLAVAQLRRCVPLHDLADQLYPEGVGLRRSHVHQPDLGGGAVAQLGCRLHGAVRGFGEVDCEQEALHARAL